MRRLRAFGAGSAAGALRDSGARSSAGTLRAQKRFDRINTYTNV